MVAGDKVIERRARKTRARAFEREQLFIALLVAPKGRWPNAGRIVTGEAGSVLRIIERADLASAESSNASFTVRGEARAAKDIEAAAETVNQAVYLFRASALFNALDALSTGNVQKEEYLTDTIEHIVQNGGRVVSVPVHHPDDVLAFNNPEELLEIEEYFRRKSGIDVKPARAFDPRIFKSPADWGKLLQSPGLGMTQLLRERYGDNESLRDRKRARLLAAVELFIGRFGNEGLVTVIRAPGA